ncbi:MAG: hypothetical protein HY260_11215 [Chloroflexi bacterium]|nr:hypothetical protein [Chloroflexota bacterium]
MSEPPASQPPPPPPASGDGPPPSLIPPPTPPPSRPGVKLPPALARLLADPAGRVVIAITVLGVCGLALLVCVAIASYVIDNGVPAIPLPFAATPTATLQPTEYVPSEALVSSENVKVPLAIPEVLKFVGVSFPVASVEASKDGVWQVPMNQKTTAFWVHGTLINYVFGLPDTSDNESALDGLVKGDSIEVQMSDGRALRFQVTRKASVPASTTGIFEQTRPGLTLVLVGGRGATRLAVEALFVGQSGTAATIGSSGPVDLGVPAQAGDLRVTVTATRLVTSGASELPSGLGYYLVDFTVENTGPGPVEASLVVAELVDSTGARYAPVIPVSAITTYPPLAGKLDPNSTTNATAAYLVAATFSDPAPIWRFSPEAGSRDLAQVRLAASAASIPAVSVTLESAALSDDQTELILSGTVVNLGTQERNVTQADLALLAGTGQAGEYHSATPPLPWSLAAGAFQPYKIVFARPATASAVFKLLGWQFEVTGLP